MFRQNDDFETMKLIQFLSMSLETYIREVSYRLPWMFVLGRKMVAIIRSILIWFPVEDNKMQALKIESSVVSYILGLYD